MKILLTAINAKYIHSNLAVYSLQAYAKKHGQEVEVAEYTINHRTDFILQEIYKKKPDVLCFSCYIWNFSMVCELMEEMHKLRPELPIWVGGPEVSYECEAFLQEYSMVTGVMRGEGEETFVQLCEFYNNHLDVGKPSMFNDCSFCEVHGHAYEICHVMHDTCLADIAGIVFRNTQGEIVVTADREPLDMDELPFCYNHLEDFEHRIIYYESSRGCPFRCSYCLSSIEKSLRFRSLELVYNELKFFLDKKVPQIKFVDRTFNCNHHHAMSIWRFLQENDNGITNFHFEVSADLLTDEEIAFIANMRPGLIQLEIGVQSTNPKTVEEIRRVMDLKRLCQVVQAVKESDNIHQHLDLIAGLPFEDYETFQRSFDEIYALRPQQLQLGFLKVLKGSYMYEKREDYGLKYHSKPPYEVLETKWLSYEEILKIKHVEEMLEVYYNSAQFEMTMQVLEQAFQSPFEMFLKLGEYYEKHGLFFMNHSRIRRCEILLDFVKEWDKEHIDVYQETLTFDLYYRENMKSRPSWAPETALFKEESRRICGKHKNVHLEPFYHEFSRLLQKKQQGYPPKQQVWQFYLFSYEEKNHLTGQAKVERIQGA